MKTLALCGGDVALALAVLHRQWARASQWADDPRLTPRERARAARRRASLERQIKILAQPSRGDAA